MPLKEGTADAADASEVFGLVGIEICKHCRISVLHCVRAPKLLRREGQQARLERTGTI